MTTLDMIRKIVSLRARLNQIMLWLDPSLPNYTRTLREFQSSLRVYDSFLVLCAEDLATGDVNLRGVQSACEEPQPWWVDPAVGPAEVVEFQKAPHLLAELIPDNA